MTEFDERFLVRGKRKDNGEWIYGFVIKNAKGDYRIEIVDENGCYANIYNVLPDTLGRYTGMKDLDGTMKILSPELIYEIEHGLISECGNIWEYNTDDATRLAFYEQGIHDMAVAIIDKISEVRENND